MDIYEQVLFSWRPFGNNRHLGAEPAWGIALGSRGAAAKHLPDSHHPQGQIYLLDVFIFF